MRDARMAMLLAGVLANVSVQTGSKNLPSTVRGGGAKDFPWSGRYRRVSFAVTLSSVRPSARPPAPATSKRTDDTHTSHTPHTNTNKQIHAPAGLTARDILRNTHACRHAVRVSPPTDAHPATCDTDKRAHRQTYRHTCSHERKSVLHAILDVAQRVHAPRLSPHLP